MMHDLLSFREWLAVIGTSLFVGAGIVALTANTTAAVAIGVVSLGVPVILMVPAAVSNAWSVFPAFTAYKACEYFVDVALLAAIIAELRSLSDLKSLYDCTWVLLASLLASVWLGVVLAPGEAVVRGIGVTGVQIYGVI